MKKQALLCTTTFPANTGFAWTFIEGIYAKLANRLAEFNVDTLVAYPEIDRYPDTLKGSCATPIVLDMSLNSRASRANVRSVIRDKHIKVVYLTDRELWNPYYYTLRRAGCQSILIHDHTSGARCRPRNIKKVAKAVIARTPFMVADHYIGVSDFVSRRIVESALIPERKVYTVWNGLDNAMASTVSENTLHSRVGVSIDRPLIVCSCRATPDKGVQVLLAAFDALCRSWSGDRDMPVLVYMGDGPYFNELRRQRDTLCYKDNVFMLGYVANAAELLGSATVSVVPSIWKEAFSLAVLEGMLRGIPVVASRVGGIPEVVNQGEAGVLIPPNDVDALMNALSLLLTDGLLAQRIGDAGKKRALDLYGSERQIDAILSLILPSFTALSQGGQRW